MVTIFFLFQVFDLKPYEFLVEVSRTKGEYLGLQNIIRSLTFVTNVKSYGPYGIGKGHRPFKLEAPSEYCIVGFFARAADYLDAIGVYACRI